MAPRMQLDLSGGNLLYYLHSAPTREDAATFVFVNALTGSTDTWEVEIGEALRREGFGTLSWNFRGQAGSAFDPELALTDRLITADLARLLHDIAPSRPVLVGLSIGGLYAARAVLGGTHAEGLVLINTLREVGPRIDWINSAMARLAAHGGLGLFLDAIFPLLVNPDFAQKVRPNFLGGDYAPLPPEHGHMNLVRHAAKTDWTIDYSALALPTLVITGLHDRVFLDREVVDRLFARLPDGQREDWPDAGHLIPQEKPERLASRLASFAAEIGA